MHATQIKMTENVCTYLNSMDFLCGGPCVPPLKIFVSAIFFKKSKTKRFYFRFENTFVSQMFSKTFSFWKIVFSFRKHFHFCFGNTSLNKLKEIASSFSSWPMRATLGWGPVFPLDKAWFADSLMSMSFFFSFRKNLRN